MFSLDEDDEGEISVGESSDAEREMTPDVPKAPSVKTFDDGGDFEGASDVDQRTLRAFVVAVIYANAAVLLVALGPMVWYFEGWSRVGPALFVVGLFAGVRTYQTYRSWKRSRDEKRDADPEPDANLRNDTAPESDADPDAAPEAAPPET
ncbi:MULTISPECIES: DUF7322 domain-containing protein [Halorubrum]|uniref:DUF7322 domain-containing protein n=1 Tax=Halorubrum sodomense TaxID=35743 RepID=A0A1I6FTL5_HALSD|nr:MULTISPECIES: hypothetical protein [Halorubrum]TKX69516.1 hypothetical protein EXE45_07750 [Halorubrum sp. SP9]SFR33292.1 hypothetical protein SAMN04487937_1188 [Halorubrum sodomense]